jgi:hypothetical protein
MANMSQHNTPKMQLSGQGMGLYTQADIDRRAVELALIDNRAEATDEDRARALAEFQDRELPDAVTEDEDTTQSMSRDPSDPIADRGRQTPEYASDADQKTVVEKLALEGVEEAQHDQMVQSRNLIDEPLRSRPKRKRK